jgi:hypothetical protein
MNEYRILFTKRKVVDTKEMRKYCSDECMIRSRYFASQLSDEPIYLRGYARGLGNPPIVRLLPMNQDLSQMMEHAHDVSPDVSIKDPAPESKPVAAIPTTSVENYVELLISSLPKSVEKLVIHERSIVEKPTPPSPLTTPVVSVTNLFKNEATEHEQPVIVKKKLPKKKSAVFKSSSVVEKRTKAPERMEDVSITVLRPDDEADDASFGFISDADEDVSDYDMDDDDDGSKEYEKSDVDMSASAMSDVSYSPNPSQQPILKQLKMSTFGTLWTWFDRCVTIDTRRFLSRMGRDLRDRHRVPTLPRPGAETQTVENTARRDALGQNILTTYASIRSFAQLNVDGVEDALLATVATMNVSDAENWTEKELWIVALVFLRCLAWHRIPDLDRLPWERAARKAGMSFAQIQAMVDVFKLDEE